MDRDHLTQQIFEVVNPKGCGRFVVVCEHASNAIPAVFDNLGLGADALQSHIAWDPGAMAVASGLSRLLDAPLVASRVSRLVYDCNRPPDAPDAVPARSERFDIPGNIGLSDAARRARFDTYGVPFHGAVDATLAEHRRRVSQPILMTVHSFTPVDHGIPREVGLGILYEADRRVADVLLAVTKPGAAFPVRLNEPYGPADGVLHSLSIHGDASGMLNVMLEIRNDLIATADAQEAMADWLAAGARTASTRL